MIITKKTTHSGSGLRSMAELRKLKPGDDFIVRVEDGMVSHYVYLGDVQSGKPETHKVRERKRVRQDGTLCSGVYGAFLVERDWLIYHGYEVAEKEVSNGES